MSDNNENQIHSEELFNTDDLMQSEDINLGQNTNEIVKNSEDHETQITNLIKESDNNTEINEGNIENDINIAEDVVEEEIEQENTDEISDGAVKKKVVKSNAEDRITNLPLAKVKHIIKLDPDVKLVNGEAVYLITKATEMFIKTLAKEAFGHAAQTKKKTIAKNHVDQALSMLPIEL